MSQLHWNSFFELKISPKLAQYYTNLGTRLHKFGKNYTMLVQRWYKIGTELNKNRNNKLQAK